MSIPASGSNGSCLICANKNWSLVIRSPDTEYHCKPGEFDLVECPQDAIRIVTDFFEQAGTAG